MKVMCKTGPGGCLPVTTTTTESSAATTTTTESSTVTTATTDSSTVTTTTTESSTITTTTTDSTVTTTTTDSSTVTSCVVQTGCGNLVEEDIGYKGTGNVKSFNDGSVTDFSSCAQECLNFEGCNFWTFTNSGKCHLKPSDCGRENRRGFISGQKPCA